MSLLLNLLDFCPPTDGESDPELGEEEDFSKLYSKGLPSNPGSFSYLNLTDSSYSLGEAGASYDISPLSSPDKDLGGKRGRVLGLHQWRLRRFHAQL